MGPCTSNYFVASRFRATVLGIAAMRQAFEDVIYDFKDEFPGPGFKVEPSSLFSHGVPVHMYTLATPSCLAYVVPIRAPWVMPPQVPMNYACHIICHAFDPAFLDLNDTL